MSATLEQIVGAIPGKAASTGTADISDVTHDSRRAGPGTLFVAIPGSAVDGHEFVASAIEQGASAIMVERPTGSSIPAIIVDDARAAMAYAANVVHGMPDRDLTLLGVTGTNGKTTVVHMCRAVWRAMGEPHAAVGTLGARINDQTLELGHTTPEASDLQRLLASMRDQGVESVAMEVSSHALDLHRVDAMNFDVVGFTNLSQDHLDFHGTMDAYFDSKKALFDPARASRGVINIDDRYGEILAASTALEVITVGADADVRVVDAVSSGSGSHMTVTTPWGTGRMNLPLVGAFNVTNALVATGMLGAAGVDIGAICEGMATLEPISGRMERVNPGGEPAVYVDYAHTPDAIASVLDAAAAFAKGRLIAVVGAAGDRDPKKREAMGAAAASRSDVTIVTTDNPRSEDPETIASVVRRGAEAVGRGAVRSIIDRRVAIETAIEGARAGDVVLILGKGHEQGQEVKGVIRPFDDRQVAAGVLGVPWPAEDDGQ